MLETPLPSNNISLKNISGFGYSSHLGELIPFLLSDKPIWDHSCVALSPCGTSPVGEQILLPLKLVQVLPRTLGLVSNLMFTPFKIPPHKQVDFSCPWSSLSKWRVQLFYLAHVPCDGQSCIFYFFWRLVVARLIWLALTTPKPKKCGNQQSPSCQEGILPQVALWGYSQGCFCLGLFETKSGNHKTRL